MKQLKVTCQEPILEIYFWLIRVSFRDVTPARLFNVE
jgi:hypothetical protein